MGNKFIKSLVIGVMAIVAFLFLTAAFPLLFPILVIVGLVFAVVAGKTVLPTWREKYPAWTGKGAVARAVHGISTCFASMWFAGALLARSMIGRAILTWIIVALVIDFVYVSPIGDPVSPWIIGWTGLALLSGLYGWTALAIEGIVSDISRQIVDEVGEIGKQLKREQRELERMIGG